MPIAPRLSDAEIAELAFAHLQRVVAIDSQSDEASDSIPTTAGQRRLADELAIFYASKGAHIERDEHANVLAWFAGRGALAERAPVALLVHVDTARGTMAVPALRLRRAWDGTRISFPKNAAIRVDVDTYPALAAWVGQDLVHGDGECPFGLDDKLGLAECMTLAELLAAHPDISHPPLVLVGRPDEEVGRHGAVVGLARLFAERGVRFGYTVDGIWPFEINVENFEAASASVTFPSRVVPPWGTTLEAHIGGVNTHGATAYAEGHRAATRLAAEWRASIPAEDARFVGFVSDALRDCDAVVRVQVSPGAEDGVRHALAAVMAPHLDRGASVRIEAVAESAGDLAADGMLRWVAEFYDSNPGFTLACEASEGRDGYSHPYRARPVEGGLRLDVRIRDFAVAGLERRVEHVRKRAGDLPFSTARQYVNMGPRLAPHPELVTLAHAAAAAIGLAATVSPIRGGTGVDPFLDAGVPIANLGTGYFAPESEKEFTSLQAMVGHAKWLFALVQLAG